MSRGRDTFKKNKALISLVYKTVKILPYGFRKTLFYKTRHVSGKKGIAIRYILLKTLAKSCGDNVVLMPDVYLLNVQNLSVGTNVAFNPFCYIECGFESGITIGNDVGIAHGVSILATNHRFDDPDICIGDQPLSEKKVEIGNDVWIGCKATILSGALIEDRCIIAANAVVTKKVESHTLVAGVPAKLIKKI